MPIDKIPVYIREGSFLPLRLNESLKLGESMSESETEMILAVVPQNDSIVKETLYERSGAKTCCGMEKNGETIQLQISGRTAELYVMLAGIHWKSTEAIVNGRTLTKVTAREGLYFTEGYLELEEGILVKINPSAESVIKIQKNKINIKENLINSRMRTEHISRDLKSPPFCLGYIDLGVKKCALSSFDCKK